MMGFHVAARADASAQFETGADGFVSTLITFRDACNQAAAAGLLLVTSVGNFGTFDGTGDTIAYPARYSSVIAVGATMNVDNERALKPLRKMRR